MSMHQFGSSRRRRLHRRSGFVLVLTLFVLLITASILVNVGNHSLKSVLNSKRNEAMFKTKWTRYCVENVLFQNATSLFTERASDNRPKRIARFDLSIKLNLKSVSARLKDESSCFSINQARQTSSDFEVERAIRQIGGNVDVVIQFTGNSVANGGAPVWMDRLQSWDQVFQTIDGALLRPEQLLVYTDRLTLWSSLTNFWTADDDVVFETIKLKLGPNIANKVITARRDELSGNLSKVLAMVDCNERQRSELRSLFAEESQARSAWTQIRDGNTVQYQLAIEKSISDGIKRYVTINWPSETR